MIEQEFVEINQINGFLTYLWSIDWSDPWLIALCLFHISVTISLFVMKNHSGFQAILFFVLLLLVYFSESINELASTNWKIFSKQQYFDSRGLFISIVFSVPILLNCMILIGSWLYYSYVMMSTLKTAQLKDSIRREKAFQEAKKANKQE